MNQFVKCVFDIETYFLHTLKLVNFYLLYLARVERLELPANGFGDHYSTN